MLIFDASFMVSNWRQMRAYDLKTRYSFLCIIGILLVAAVVDDHLVNSLIVEPAGPNQVIIPSYIEHDPIDIRSNDDFETQGWPGNGTENDPYIIEGLTIADTLHMYRHL